MATYDLVEIPATVAWATKDARRAQAAFVGIVAPVAPTFGSFSPVAGAVSRTAAVSFTVTDLDGLDKVMIWAEYQDGTLELVYDGTAFSSAFDAASSVSGATTLTFSIQRDAPGWTANYTLEVRATDITGASAVASSAYTLTNPPAAPQIGGFDPAPGAVARADSVDFAVSSPDGLSEVVVWATLAGGSTVLVYADGAFGPDVDAASSVSGTTTKTFSITHDGDGWPDDYTLHVLAVDARGVSASANAAYTLSNPPEPPEPPDTTEPTVTLVSPAEDSEITRTTAIVVDVTDAGGLAAVFVWVTYPGRAPELAHDWESFSDLFAASSRASIPNGYRYTLRRTGGWPAAPTVRVRPVDASGNTP